MKIGHITNVCEIIIDIISQFPVILFSVFTVRVATSGRFSIDFIEQHINYREYRLY